MAPLLAKERRLKSKKSPARRKVAPSSKDVAVIANWLQLGRLRSEKCELKEASVAFEMAYRIAKRGNDIKGMMEALSGMLRLACEALDEAAIVSIEEQLDSLIAAYPRHLPAMTWFCKGRIARFRRQHWQAQRLFHRYIRAIRSDPKNALYGEVEAPAEAIARGWVSLAGVLVLRGSYRRAQWLGEEVLRRWGDAGYRGLAGNIDLLLGDIQERQRDYASAMSWYQKAHSAFLSEHNWFYHLYALYGYARIARHQRSFTQAYWYLDLLDKATGGREFGLLRREIASERSRLEQDAVDLLIDSRKGVVKTREGEEISLGKQYVLLHILEALTGAHNRAGDDFDRGLSKADIIQHVWRENYRPEAHDNKLYYNINRLRKLIEPDVRRPQYLLNWKEGYRLAPGLKIQFIGGRSLELEEGPGGLGGREA
jgi:DNA-binding winged helix-turn-helix (wHTH) protein